MAMLRCFGIVVLFLISSGYGGIGNGVFECGSAKAQPPGPVDPGEVEATLCYGYRLACDPPATAQTCAGTQCYWGEAVDFNCSQIDEFGYLSTSFICEKDADSDPVYEAVNNPTQENCDEHAAPQDLDHGERSESYGSGDCNKKRLCQSSCVILSGSAGTVMVRCYDSYGNRLADVEAKIKKSRCQSDSGGSLSPILDGDDLDRNLIQLYLCKEDVPCTDPSP